MTSDQILQSSSEDPLSHYIEDLAALHTEVEKLAHLALAGSVLERGVNSVISIFDAMKATPLGGAWKTAVKFIPQIATVYDAAVALRQALGQLGGPLSTLRRQAPVVIKALQEQQAGQPAPAGYSGLLWTISSPIPEVRNGLEHLHQLIETSCKAAAALRGAGGHLSTAPGLGQVAARLSDAIARLEAALGETQTTLVQVSGALEKTATWLPSYQIQSRRLLTADLGCQATVKSGLFTKELCQNTVTSFDDQAPAACGVCHIAVCEKHRVEVPTTSGSSTRNTWLCLQCAAKQRR